MQSVTIIIIDISIIPKTKVHIMHFEWVKLLKVVIIKFYVLNNVG